MFAASETSESRRKTSTVIGSVVSWAASVKSAYSPRTGVVRWASPGIEVLGQPAFRPLLKRVGIED